MPKRPRLSRYPAAASAVPLAAAMGQYVLGVGEFRESAFLSSDADGRGQWCDVRARLSRYEVYWGHYEGNVYRQIHRYAAALKERFALYNHIRPIYNPTYRLVQFYAQHLMGGLLDRDAGDGEEVPSCLPIVTDHEAIRPGIASVWHHSNWQAKKDVWTTYGAAMGDAPLMVVDDPANGRVTLKPIHPRVLTHFERDDYGNCRGYRLDDWRPDPEYDLRGGIPPLVRYTEVCEKVGSSVQFTTLRDDAPYDWRAYDDDAPESDRHGASWTEPYGFVPLVLVQHVDKGLGWGWSELHPTLAKMHELDDLASKLHDAVRIAVETQWFFTGVDPQTDISFAEEEDDETSSTREDDDAGRTKVKTLTAASESARATPMVPPLDLSAALSAVLALMAEIERDHPELSKDLAGLNASGKARRVAQEHVEAMVAQRRAGYDDGLARALKMALSIGGMKGYPGFEGIDEGSYERGELDLSVGDRPVFSVDQMDRIEEDQARANHLKTLVDSRVPTVVAMRIAGYPDDIVKDTEAESVLADQKAVEAQRKLLMGSEDPNAAEM